MLTIAKKILLFLFIFFLLPFSATRAYARSANPENNKCYCTAPSFDSRWKQADAVFTGTVTRIQVLKKYAIPDLEYTPVEVTLTIDKGYKGIDKQKDFVLNTSLTKENCNGFPFQEGQGYLIFAYQRNEGGHDNTSSFVFPLGTYNIGGLCGGSKKISEAGEDLNILERKGVSHYPFDWSR